ncbi:MAG: hypothetical protein RJB61_2136, partial [Actinomycetota bacterium]
MGTPGRQRAGEGPAGADAAHVRGA